jgi:hypothetical protein
MSRTVFPVLALLLCFGVPVRAAGGDGKGQLVSPWLGPEATWDRPVLGGSISVDGREVYAGGGVKIGTYRGAAGRFTAWNLEDEFTGGSAVKSAFVTQGVMSEPRPWGLLMVDLVPVDGKEREFRVRLPLSPQVKKADHLVKDYRPSRAKGPMGHHAQLSYYKYYKWYDRERFSGIPNFAADTVLVHPRGESNECLMTRIVEPVNGPVFPAACRQSGSGKGAGTELVFSGKGKVFHLKVLILNGVYSDTEKPRWFSAWEESAPSERMLRVQHTGLVYFRSLETGRTVARYLAGSTGTEFMIGWADTLDDQLDSLLDDNSR